MTIIQIEGFLGSGGDKGRGSDGDKGEGSGLPPVSENSHMEK
jgi:hypothetical protein